MIVCPPTKTFSSSREIPGGKIRRRSLECERRSSSVLAALSLLYHLELGSRHALSFSRNEPPQSQWSAFATAGIVPAASQSRGESSQQLFWIRSFLRSIWDSGYLRLGQSSTFDSESKSSWSWWSSIGTTTTSLVCFRNSPWDCRQFGAPAAADRGVANGGF